MSSIVRAPKTKELRVGSWRIGDSGERGDTLIEVLMALVVLSLAALAILIAFSTSVSSSQEHRNLATANIVLTSASQQAIAQIEQMPTLFGCDSQNQSPPVTETTYVLDSIQITPAPNYGSFTATVYSVQYWNGTSFQSSCIPGSNPPLEVTIEVDGAGGPYFNTFVVDLPSGILGSANDLSNGVISQLVFTSLKGTGGTGSSGVAFSPQPVVVALDSNNNVVGSSNPFISLGIESGPSPSALSGCSENSPNGVASFSGCTVTGPAGTYVISASFNNNAIISDPSLTGLNYNSYNKLGTSFWQTPPTNYTTTFAVTVAGAPDKVVFAQAPIAGASGASLTKQPIINIDTSSNKVDTTQNGLVTLSLTGGALTGCTSANGTVTTTNNGETITAPVVAGAVTLAGCQFSGAIFYNATASPAGPDATIYAITASFTKASSASSQISVSGPGAASQLAFVTQPSGVSNSTATAKWPEPFAVEVEDAFGNPVYTIQNPAITVPFDPADSVSETLKNCTQASVADTAIVTFTGCNGTAYGGGLKLKASYGNPAITQDSAPFSISASAAALKFSVEPVAGQSGSAMATQPVVEVLDNLGNVDTGFSGVVTLAPSAGTLTGCTGGTPNLGFATFAGCLFAGTPGNSYTMSASINSGAITTTSTAFSPSQAGVATQLQFTKQPVAGAVAGSVMATQPVVKVEDSQGNVVISSTATISFSASANGTIANCANLTAVLGVVNVSNCTFGGTIGVQYTLTATSPGLTSAQSLPFASNTAAGTEAGVTISATPTSVPASNITNAQLNFQVVDNWGNSTVSSGVTVLTVSSSSTAGFFGTAPGVVGPLGTSATVSIPSGAPTTTEFYGDELVGTPTIFAYDAQTARSFGSATLTITPNAASQLVYSNAPPATVTAGQPFSVGVTEEDQFNNIVSTDSATKVSLAASNGFTSGGFNCSSMTATVVDGVATFSNCSYTSASSHAYVLTASATGLTSATASTTVSAGPAAKVIVWSGNNQSSKVSTAFAFPLSVLVTDSSGNPVSGATVKFTSPTNNPTGKFSTTGGVCSATGTPQASCTAVTNTSGIATSSTMTAGTTVGNFSVTAAVTGATSATFSETNSNGTLSFLTSAQSFTTNSGTTSGSVVIQTQDGNGSPVVQSTALTVNLTYNKTGTFVFSTDPTTVTIPAGSSYVAFTVAATSATGTPTFTVAAAATGYAGATSPAEAVRTGGTTAGAIGTIAPVTVTSASQNATFSVVITNSTTANFWYSVVNVNGLLTGETSTPSGTCQEATRNGGKATITEAVNVGTNRPSGAYTMDFVVESYSQDNFNGCGGTETYFQGDGTLTVSLGASTLAVNGGYGQTVANGTSFGAPLSVIVTDGQGKPVSGVVVTFSAPTTGASGTFLALTNGGTCVASGTAGAIAVTSCTATTNVNGIASTLTFAANAVTGAFAAQATATGTTPASVSFEEENQ